MNELCRLLVSLANTFLYFRDEQENKVIIFKNSQQNIQTAKYSYYYYYSEANVWFNFDISSKADGRLTL